MNWIISEGTPTLWGGRTVRIELAPGPTPYKATDCYPERSLNKRPVMPHRSGIARNKRIQTRYLGGRTAAELAREFNLAEASIYYILHAMGTQMRPRGKRVA